MTTYNIVAFDGGGIRGALSAALLRELVRDAGDFLDRIDLFAGTSIGAGNALGMAAGRSVDELVAVYVDHGHQVFGERMPDRGPLGSLQRVLLRVPLLAPLVAWADSLFLPKWSNAGIRCFLADEFGDETLGQLRRRAAERGRPRATVVIPACRLAARRAGSAGLFTAPVLMHNIVENEHDGVRIADAWLRSGAAPTYFESHQGFVDGGIFANNPSMAALAVALDRALASRELVSIRMLSIGTGLCPDGIEAPQPLRWGVLEWGPRIYSVTSTTLNEAVAYHASQILGPHYYRLDQNLDRSAALDDPREVAGLIRMAERMKDGEAYRGALRFVRRHFLGETV